MRVTVEVTAEDGTDSAWIDVEADSIEQAQELALQQWTGGPAVAGRVFQDITNSEPAEVVEPVSPVDTDKDVLIVDSFDDFPDVEDITPVEEQGNA
jgi:hypothetical protein